jgi:hypothetical protein
MNFRESLFLKKKTMLSFNLFWIKKPDQVAFYTFQSNAELEAKLLEIYQVSGETNKLWTQFAGRIIENLKTKHI